jgi:hypothetical protein
MRPKTKYANSIFSVRKPCIALTGLLALISALWVFTGKDALSMDLTPFAWKNRLLLMFAPDDRNSHLKKLKTEIDRRQFEVDDRDLVVFEVLESGPSLMGPTELGQTEADALRDRFKIPRNAFMVVLVGKDGGVKLKSDERVTIDDVFDLIDSMPMRQNEMRRNKQ